jgi:hypothetical protein
MSPSGSIQHPRRTTVATEAELTDKIQRTKAALLVLGDLRPGALSEQYNTCRTPGCRCKADPPQRHGPYHQLSYSHHGKSRTENIRPEHIDTVNSQIANYRKLRELIDQWIDAAIELDRLRRNTPKQASRAQTHSQRPFTSNRHGPSRLDTQTPAIPGLPGLRCPSTTVLRLV